MKWNISRLFSRSSLEQETQGVIRLDSEGYECEGRTKWSKIGVGVYQGEVLILHEEGTYDPRFGLGTETLRNQDLHERGAELVRWLRWAAVLLESRLQSDPEMPDSLSPNGTVPENALHSCNQQPGSAPSSSVSGGTEKSPISKLKEKEEGQ